MYKYSREGYLNKVRHGKVHDVVFPSQLQDDIRVQQVIALEQAGCKTVVCLVVKEVSQQILNKFFFINMGKIFSLELTSATSAFLDSAAYSMASLNKLS